ncbi:MAG: TRAP transporter substrate-binding protein [Faecalibacterium prausnitzii]|nr:TRAP transporter substrate-binding protein [Faecalibacterium prausnitzii]
MAAAGVAALGLCGCLRKEETGAQLPELILRYAENQPEDYPTTQAALAFAQLVEQQTGGRVKVVVYSGGELGAEQSVIQQMQFGGIDFARVSLSPLAGYIPELSILQLPYLYKDADQMWRVLDGSIGDEFLGMLDQMDLVGLSWFDAGVRSFYTREKVTTLEQLQKLTIRVQESDVMSGMIKDLGAKPVQLAYSQVYAALHNGQIDGAENNWPSYQTMGHYEVAPYFLQDEHTRVPEIQLASIAAMEKLEKLDPAFPEILRDCARQSARTERKLWAKRETDSEQELRRWGVEVTVPSKEEKKKFRAAVQPLYDRFEQQAEILERIRNT